MSRVLLLLVALIAGGLAAFLATRGAPPPAQQDPQAPAIIEEAHATHFIPPGWELVTRPSGDLIATKRAGGAA